MEYIKIRKIFYVIFMYIKKMFKNLQKKVRIVINI